MTRPDRPERRPRTLLLALVLTCATLVTLDHQGGEDSVVEPLRRVAGEALGPVQAATATLVRPFVAVPAWFQSRSDLRHDVARLQAENSELRAEMATSDFDRNRLAELDELTSMAQRSRSALVPARVVGLGPTQSFSRTVTLDAGSSAGLAPDQTVVNGDGLVGRVLRVTRTTATVLLVVDEDSVVGARVGQSMEVGFLNGRGVVGDDGVLDLELVDGTVVPARGDSVLTWGSDGGAPYVAGVPVGRVTEVFASLRDSSQRAVVEPYVDFSSLDLVGVVVPTGTESDRTVIEADGSRQ
jgi:rod shape-determining protein MreC